jgi:hypothetical protein
LAGIALAAFPVEEHYVVEDTIEVWTLQGKTLEPPPSPRNRTFWGRLMRRGWWFELNVSASQPVRLTVSSIQRFGGSPMMSPFFDKTSASFKEWVRIGSTGTYQIDIINEGTSDVNLQGNVIAKMNRTEYERLYPYATLGTLIASTGLPVFIFGILSKRRKK